MIHETSFIKNFISQRQQDRLLGFISNASKRNKFLEYLPHKIEFDKNRNKIIDVSKKDADEIYKIIKEIVNIDTCYVISENPRLDKQELNILYALKEVVGYGMGTILSIVLGKIIYYEAEEMSVRFLLLN